jgi:hypothetical protein
MLVRKKIGKRKDKILHAKEEKYDFLKHWAVVRKWAIYNYNLKSSADLDMLLFLYSEKLFTRSKFADYACFMPWEKTRFDRLLRDGFVIIWRKKGIGESNLYQLSFSAKKMIASMYRKLLGLEPFPETARRNNVFKPNASFSEKTLAQAIKRINNDFRERKQRPSPE